MDFSLLFFSGEGDSDAPDKYRLYLDSARFADRNGFAAIWTPERHFHPFGGLYPNPAVAASALAMITERIQLRAGSVVLPLNHVARVVEEWAMVDNLSGGRVAVSFAPGWVPNDFVLAPGNFADRKAVMHASIETVRRLWRGEPLRAENGKGREALVQIYPRPIQPELPVWLTSRGTPETFEKAGTGGFNILTHLLGQTPEKVAVNIAAYREARAQAGHDPAAGTVTLMLHSFLADSIEAARETVRDPFCRYLKTSLGLLSAFIGDLMPGADLSKLTEDDVDALLGFAFDRYFEKSGLFGTPASCAGLVEELGRIGVDEIACLIDFGIEREATMASLRRVAALMKDTAGPTAAAAGNTNLNTEKG